jgi:hypothetical protein
MTKLKKTKKEVSKRNEQIKTLNKEITIVRDKNESRSKSKG